MYICMYARTLRLLEASSMQIMIIHMCVYLVYACACRYMCTCVVCVCVCVYVCVCVCV